MLSLPSAVQARLASGVTATLTLCFWLRQKDGVIVRGTMHDRDVTIVSGEWTGTYPASVPITPSDSESKSDGSVANAEVETGLRVDASVPDFSVEKLEAGIYDQVPAALLLVDWEIGAVVKVLVAGTTGEFVHDDTGRLRSEVRGVTQLLKQQILRTASERCDVKRFGGERCTKNVAAISRTGTVTAVQHRKRFTATLDPGPAPLTDIYYVGGQLRFTSGDNDGFVREVRAHDPPDMGESIELLLWDEAPADVAVDDTFHLEPGCDRTAGTCRYTHDNFVNFQGIGLFCPGRDRMMAGPLSPDTFAIPVIKESDQSFDPRLKPDFSFLEGKRQYLLTEEEHNAIIAAIASEVQELL
jgi:uncharacterized phage protein (TIGR02218 family)